MPKIVITAVYAFEPNMDDYPSDCQTIEDVQQYIQTDCRAEDELLKAMALNDSGILDCKVEIDRSDEG